MTTFFDLLTVIGVLAGIGGLLFLMSALDPTSVRRPPAHRGTRERSPLAAPPFVGKDPAPRG